MALLSKKEFSELCRMESKKLSVYISRNKVAVNDNDMIDDTDPLNRMFVDRQKELALKRELKKKVAKDSPEDDDPVDEKPKKSKNPGKSEAVTGELSQQTLEKISLDKRKREIEIEKLHRESRILSVQEQKLAGKLIPTDMVKGLFAQHFKSIIMSFNQGIEQILVEFSTKYRLNRNEKAELKGQMIRIINKSVDESIQLSKKEIENIVMEYSQVKNLK